MHGRYASTYATPARPRGEEDVKNCKSPHEASPGMQQVTSFALMAWATDLAATTVLCCCCPASASIDRILLP
nr:hypothetical protein HmN_000790700 [Hymenolepis microstoma]